MSEAASVTVHDRPESNRFEARDESGVVAGFAQYENRGDTLVFVHTEVDDAFEGEGVGSVLARGALDQARASGRPVIAECSFIKGYIDKHEEYQDLLAG